jgi:hypothetical protein
MKKTLALFLAFPALLLAFQTESLTAYKSGTIKIVPDPAFGTDTEWDVLFRMHFDIWTVFLPGGTFFRTASADGQVHKFDPDGKLVKSFGRKGQGPGDLMNPGALDVLGGKTLVVNDAGNRRLSLFDLEGNFLKSVKLGENSGPPMSVLSFVALGGDKIAYVVQETRTGPPTVIAARLRVLAKDLGTGQETELAAFDWEKPRSKFMLRVIEWEPAVYLAKAGPDKLLVAFSGTPEIAFFSFSGQKMSSFALSAEKSKITWKHLEFVMDADKNPKGFEFVAKNKADIDLPEFLPLWPRMAVDPAGRILVYDDNQARFSRDVSFKAYSQGGQLLAAVQIDPGEYAPVMPVHFWQNYAYAYLTEKDGDGPFVFARFKIIP